MIAVARRAFADILVISLLVGGDISWRILVEYSYSAQQFVTSHITAIWIVWTSVVAAIRAITGVAVVRNERAWVGGWIEWMGIVIAVHIFLCWLDTIWNPHDTFETVLAFTLLILLVPSTIVSTITYLLISMAATKFRTRSGSTTL